ncbi:MAG: WG repeat-containing protein [Oscillospiraceae bacterium]|nr:WG repeat-containing protein [Oscillospiraceae bacterium]
MKKLIPLLLAVLLLAACSTAQEVPTTLPPPTEALSSTESSTESTTAPPPTTETAPAVTEPTNPTGSFGVTVDFSQYTPRETQEALYTRLSPEPITDLRPTAAPTRIYPFPGYIMYFSYFYPQYHYGIVNEDGCILVDPIYTSVSPLYSGEKILPFWVLEKPTGRTPTSYYDSVTVRTYGLASMDGTIVIDCNYTDIVAYEDRIIATQYSEDRKSVSFDVFDLDGNKLLSSSQLSFGNKLTGSPYYHYTYGDGFYTVAFDNSTLTDPNPDLYRPDEEYATYYMDEEGTLCYGPYYDAEPFCNGLARVSAASGCWYFINTHGVPVSRDYSWCTSFQNERAIVEYTDENDDWVYEVVDTSFSPVIRSYSYIDTLGDALYTTMNEDPETGVTATVCYNAQGQQLVYRENIEFLTSTIVWHSPYEEISSLENLETGAKLDLPLNAYCNLSGSREAPFIRVTYYDNATGYHDFILREDLTKVYKGSYDYSTLTIWETGNTNTDGFVLFQDRCANVYTRSDVAPAVLPLSSFDRAWGYPNGIFAFADQEMTKLYNAQGEQFFAYPINAMDD